MRKISFIILFFFGFLLQSFAQNETDALRYSLVTPGGTARFVSMGGAFGALGGDFSTLSTNPAGIALYRSNEFTITPNLNFNKVESSFFGNMDEDIKYDFGMGNIGFVIAFAEPDQLKDEGWIGFQIGFGLNRHMNFNSRKIYEGFNTERSMMNVFLEKANMESNFNSDYPQEFLDDFTTGLAWDTWLLGLDTVNNSYFIDLDDNVLQRRITNTSGSLREMTLSLGGNYSNRLYLGATFGFPLVRFEEEYTYTEVDSENLSEEFNSLEFRENLQTTGSGFNFKIGAIFRATDMIRLGAALHTPTFYSLEDNWRTRMKSDLVINNVRETRDVSSPRLITDYELNTPLRLIGSFGLVFGTNGILSFDYEYADFTQMRLRSSETSFSHENSVIKESFQAQHNLRVGGEVRLHPVILRGGYAFSTNPYESDEYGFETSTLSAGIGLRDQSYFVDFGFFQTMYSQDFHPWYHFTGERNDATVVDYDFTQSGFMMTVGFRF